MKQGRKRDIKETRRESELSKGHDSQPTFYDNVDG